MDAEQNWADNPALFNSVKCSIVIRAYALMLMCAKCVQKGLTLVDLLSRVFDETAVETCIASHLLFT